jgi:hypothetical protein
VKRQESAETKTNVDARHKSFLLDLAAHGTDVKLEPEPQIVTSVKTTSVKVSPQDPDVDRFVELRRSMEGDSNCGAITKIMALRSSRPTNQQLEMLIFNGRFFTVPPPPPACKRRTSDVELERQYLTELVKLKALGYTKLQGTFKSDLWYRLEILEAAVGKISGEVKTNWVTSLRDQLR